jgi:N-acetylmuramoyl-L-alanine amidase
MYRHLFIISFFIFNGCGIFGPRTYHWQELPDEYYAIPPFAKYLNSMRIVIDPGHGGQGHLPGYKRGPGGLREAEVNLRVAFYLREFLETAGAGIVMTREDDSYVSLGERAEIANQSGAHFMISIHHNAGPAAGTNQAAIFYHKDANLSPASIDLARNIYFGLLDALHLPQLSEDGLYSDQLIYPDGFGLLRHTKIPAILLESSYFSNPEEEKRLTDKNYNKREAYGIFIGLCRYVSGGFPYTTLLKPDKGFSRSKKPEITVKIDDGLRQRQGPDHERLRIFTNTISVNLDNRSIAYAFDTEEETITCTPDSNLMNGPHLLSIDMQNIYKNHNLPAAHEIIIASPCQNIDFQTSIKQFPMRNRGFIPIDIFFSDRYSMPVWEGTLFKVTGANADIQTADTLLSEGKARIYAYPQAADSAIMIIAAADTYSDTLNIERDSTCSGMIQGQLFSRKDTSALADVVITLADTLIYKSDGYGVYTVSDLSSGIYDIRMEKMGYGSLFRTSVIDSGEILCDTLYLSPVHDALFHHKTIIIDPYFSDDSLGEGSVSLELLQHLYDSLLYAGADSPVIAKINDTLSLEERISRVNELKNGWYLGVKRLPAKTDRSLIEAYVYPGNVKGAAIADSIGSVFEHHGFKYRLIPTTQIAEIRNTNKTAVGLSISAGDGLSNSQIAAWIFTGLKAFYYGLEHTVEE